MNMDYSEAFELLSQDAEKERNKPTPIIPSYRGIAKEFKKAEKHDQITRFAIQEALDKLRAEIEQFAELGEVGFTKTLIPKDTVLQIIDKYKEREGV